MPILSPMFPPWYHHLLVKSPFFLVKSHDFPMDFPPLGSKLHGFAGGLGPSDFGLGTELLDGIDDEESTGN